MSFRNAILFFAIFAILTAGLIAFRVIRSGESGANATTTASTATSTELQKEGTGNRWGWPLFIPFNLSSFIPKFPSQNPEQYNPNFNSTFGSYDSRPNTEEVEQEVDRISRETTQLQKNAEVLRKQLEEQKEASEFKGKIILENLYGFYESELADEVLTIHASSDNKEKITITGWKLVSVPTGNSAVIGKGVYLPFPGTVMPEQPITVSPGDTVYISTGRSPIGVSFLLNKCTGYFEENRTFYTALRRQCPLAKNESLPQFSTVLDREDECVALISKIPICSTVTSKYKNLNKLPDTVTDSCKKYLETKINYNTCVITHFGDTDFPGKEWYIYLKIFGPLWRSKNEKITLYDSSGLIVDSIEIGSR